MSELRACRPSIAGRTHAKMRGRLLRQSGATRRGRWFEARPRFADARPKPPPFKRVAIPYVRLGFLSAREITAKIDAIKWVVGGDADFFKE